MSMGIFKVLCFGEYAKIASFGFVHYAYNFFLQNRERNGDKTTKIQISLPAGGG
jgi:hypothetical protein